MKGNNNNNNKPGGNHIQPAWEEGEEAVVRCQQFIGLGFELYKTCLVPLNQRAHILTPTLQPSGVVLKAK